MNLTDIAQGLPAELAPLAPTPAQMPSLKYTVGKIHGWLEIGQFYSCIPDAAYPWDPVVMKAIWEFAPDAIPMWVQWVFHTPPEDSESEIVIYGRHALGRKIWHPQSEVLPFPCAMPTMPCLGLTFEKPNKIWFVHTGGDNPRSRDLPGNYLGFDDTMLDRAKRSADGFKMSDEEYRQQLREEYLEGPKRRREALRAAYEEELGYAHADLERYTAKQMENVSDVEIAEWQRTVGQPKRASKPMVIVP